MRLQKGCVLILQLAMTSLDMKIPTLLKNLLFLILISILASYLSMFPTGNHIMNRITFSSPLTLDTMTCYKGFHNPY